MKPLTISLIQFDISWENKEKNLAYLAEKVKEIKEAHIVILPEMFATGFSMNRDLAEEMDGLIINWLKETAKQNKRIIAGSVMIIEGNKIYNRLIWMLPNGQFYHYDKRHLFSLANEDQYFTAGEKRLVVVVNGWKINLQICYDLRFPVWARQTKEPYDLLINIANWPEKRIAAWDILLQARAIENQCFVLGINRVGHDGNEIYHNGNSAIIDPLGKIIARNENEEIILTHTFLEKDFINIRTHFSFLNDADNFLIL